MRLENPTSESASEVFGQITPDIVKEAMPSIIQKLNSTD